MSLIEQFSEHLASLQLPRCRALVAVSGGPDSVTLLDLLVSTASRHGMELCVAHANHGIHPESDQAAEQVRALALSYGLPFESCRLELGADAGETLARARRYAWLESLRVRVGAELIFTAHHADDQVETVLMRVLEGSGPAGLAGMAAVQGRVVRPLLPFRRGDLLRHLRRSGRPVWLDPANQDTRHLRSWIRTELLPMLYRRLPEVDAKLRRVSEQAGRDRAAWDAALGVLPGLDLRLEPEAISVAASGLQGYDSPLRQAIVQALARKLGCTLGPLRLRRVLELFGTGRSGSRVPLGSRWNAEVAFDRFRIYVTPEPPLEAPWAMAMPSGEGAWGRWRFRWEVASAPPEHQRSGRTAWFTLDPLTVRAWHPGEKLKPLGGQGRRLVVRCFQDGRVPRSRRGSWPVLTQQDDLIWIPGLCRSAVRVPAPGTEALRVDAEYA
ncbi:MAG TPA: tRNA lysidine(34) synthetase TilS [Gemmatimonadales bacterium]|nr:tRNA lysidine(34) synthetase TilS [Gemmatimonadales bacterium]